MTAEDVRPPIPATCADRPVVGGLVAPFVNLRLADGGVDFRSPHHARYEECWKNGLCQTCGQRLTHPAVLFGGPNQLRGPVTLPRLTRPQRSTPRPGWGIPRTPSAW